MGHATNPALARALRPAAAIALLAALLLLVLAAAPEGAAAQSICMPNGDGTYTPTPGPGPGPPGSIEIGPGESCPTTLAEPPAPPPAELPAEPECPACPEEDRKKEGSGTGTTAASGATPYVGGGSEQLPFTGGDEVRLAFLLGGLGLVAIGFGLGLRRRISRQW